MESNHRDCPASFKNVLTLVIDQQFYPYHFDIIKSSIYSKNKNKNIFNKNERRVKILVIVANVACTVPSLWGLSS